MTIILIIAHNLEYRIISMNPWSELFEDQGRMSDILMLITKLCSHVWGEAAGSCIPAPPGTASSGAEPF